MYKLRLNNQTLIFLGSISFLVEVNTTSEAAEPL